jgi:D-beta-D-heptose 7-phosphate kinase/D-beta-D-heptose 1-phosphate adenosyltransferase
MNQQAIDRFLQQVGKVRALVVGDLILDEYLWGGTERISPEAPVPIVDVVKTDLRLGGAGNVINNLLDLGCSVDAAGVVGDDDNGRLLTGLLQKKGVGISGLQCQSGRVTSRKTRVLANHQQMLRIDSESRESLTDAIEQKILAFVAGRITDYSVIFLSDYLKGTLTESLTAALIAVGRKAGVPVAVDPKGRHYGKYRGATILTPNRREAELAADMVLRNEAALVAGGKKLQADLGLDALLITRSEEGMSLFTAEAVEHIPTRAREVFDVSGAGDTVLALVGAGLATGLGFADAATLANVGAGIVVGKLGTSTVTLVELAQAASGNPQNGKIHEREALARLLAQRRSGKQVVFTNGCFDLLHVGHVKYLQKARQLGDLLVLGLNSDQSVRNLKGPSRPLISEDERAHILAALDCIDYVTVFDEPTPLDLIACLRPDILAKGGDYTLDGVVGRELVEGWGGRVELVQFVDGKSTTGIVEKILQQYREERGVRGEE